MGRAFSEAIVNLSGMRWIVTVLDQDGVEITEMRETPVTYEFMTQMIVDVSAEFYVKRMLKKEGVQVFQTPCQIRVELIYGPEEETARRDRQGSVKRKVQQPGRPGGEEAIPQPVRPPLPSVEKRGPH